MVLELQLMQLELPLVLLNNSRHIQWLTRPDTGVMGGQIMDLHTLKVAGRFYPQR